MSTLFFKAKSEIFRSQFRLPTNEMLDGSVVCTMWAPYAKKYIKGNIPTNYLIILSSLLFKISIEFENRENLFVNKLHLFRVQDPKAG